MIPPGQPRDTADVARLGNALRAAASLVVVLVALQVTACAAASRQCVGVANGVLIAFDPSIVASVNAHLRVCVAGLRCVDDSINDTSTASLIGFDEIDSAVPRTVDVELTDAGTEIAGGTVEVSPRHEEYLDPLFCGQVAWTADVTLTPTGLQPTH